MNVMPLPHPPPSAKRRAGANHAEYPLKKLRAWRGGERGAGGLGKVARSWVARDGACGVSVRRRGQFGGVSQGAGGGDQEWRGMADWMVTAPAPIHHSWA